MYIKRGNTLLNVTRAVSMKVHGAIGDLALPFERIQEDGIKSLRLTQLGLHLQKEWTMSNASALKIDSWG